MGKSSVWIGMAALPGRLRNLDTIVPQLAPQCDQLHIHVNGGAPPTEQQWLKYPQVRVSWSQTNWGDLQKLVRLPHARGYYFTVDDDIEYPPDYVERLVHALEQENRKAVVCVHGSIFLPESPAQAHFMDRRRMFGFQFELGSRQGVLLPGTGTAAFHSDIFIPNMSRMRVSNMLDVYIGAFAAAAGLPVYSIPREKGWMRPMDNYGWSANQHRPSEAMKAVKNYYLDDFSRSYNQYVTEKMER